MSKQINFTIDVEEWFQVENLKSVFSKSSWSHQKSRLGDSIRIILEIFEKKSIKATFFVLGWIAQNNPEIVRSIHKNGHEIACHGFDHEIISRQTSEEFRRDISNSKKLLEDIISDEVIGYRAPSFSITDWSIDILKEEGFIYDSSFFPFNLHGRYGKIMRSMRFIEKSVAEFDNGLFEFSLPVVKVLNINVPFGGGFYFRFFPYFIFRSGVNRLLDSSNSFVYYLHPWEIDPGQPKVLNLRLSYKFRHYYNLVGTKSKLERISGEFASLRLKDKVQILKAG